MGVATRDNVDHHEDGENLKKYFCSWCQRIKLSNENLINDTEVCNKILNFNIINIKLLSYIFCLVLGMWL